MEFKQARLGNGLTIIAEKRPTARSLALGFFVRAGSRDETPEISGVSHFLEHMMFKGTPRRSALAVNLEFDQMGAKYNAFTSEENTVYYAAVLPEYQEQVLDLWADLMRPALREDDFDMEKGVICEEIAMYMDLPHFDVIDRGRRLHYGEHQCGNSVLGTEETIRALQAGQMRAYFEQRYSPDNMVLACTGQVDWERLVAQAEQLCGGWEAAGPRRLRSDFRGTGQSDCVVNEKIQRQHICLVSGAPSAQSELRYAAGVLSHILGDMTGSRYYWTLVDPALADSADMEFDAADGTGAFYSYISCDPDRAGQVIDIVRGCFADVRRDGVSDSELEASKNKMASSLTLHGELPMGRLVPLGFNWIYQEDYMAMEQELEKIMAIKATDIQVLLEEYPLDPLAIQGLGPKSLWLRESKSKTVDGY